MRMKEVLRDFFQIIDKELDTLPDKSTFSLPELYGEEAWEKIYIGDRVMAGNRFRREVLQGHYPNVRLLPDKDHRQRTQYVKSN